jgi:hypothetical protein
MIFMTLTNLNILMDNRRTHQLITGLILCFLIQSSLFAQIKINANDKKSTHPLIPVGWDAYLKWDQWPQQRPGTRAYMRSTYNRLGGNSDMSNYLFMKEEEYNVTLDVIGKGALYFFRTNFWHGSPWHFNIDGKDNLLKETGTDDPVNARKRFTKTEFIPGTSFPEPLAWTWGKTKGADLIWTPMPFEKSLQLAYSRTNFGTGYYIYHLYANKDQLSRPVVSWNLESTPDSNVIDLINRSGTDIAPLNIKKKVGKLKFVGDRMTIASISGGPQVIRALKLTMPLKKAIDLERIRLIATWDDRKQPSINAPLCLFFGAGTFYNRENKEYLVKGFPINIRYDYQNEKVELSCYYPMPFFSSAKLELAGIAPGDTEIDYEIRWEALPGPFSTSSYFHASYKNISEVEMGKDMILLDTKGIEEANDWSGSFVGTSMIFSHNGDLNTLEGDPRFFFDDSKSPQGQGTGTEEWSGGGFYWGGENMSLPFAGHPCGAPSKEAAKNEKDLIESSYRFLLADLMPFGKRALIQFEHGGENLSSEHYETVTYWYGLPAASLIKTDEIDIGSEESEKRHFYYSPQASQVQNITSRYELGIDSFPAQPWAIPGSKDTVKPANYQQLIGKEVYPAHTMDGRFTKGVSEFTVKLKAGNQGALLRRTLDYSFPNQKAEIYIADVSKGNKYNLRWKYAGIWYLAGSATLVQSFPRGELDKRLYNVRTSNRLFRDDEFIIPAILTKNAAAIRVRVKPVIEKQELYPGKPYPKESTWSELAYDIYTFILPDFKLKRTR